MLEKNHLNQRQGHQAFVHTDMGIWRDLLQGKIAVNETAALGDAVQQRAIFVGHQIARVDKARDDKTNQRNFADHLIQHFNPRIFFAHR